MKKFITTSILFALLATFSALMAQEQKEDYLGLPGDNLNLYAVMNLFRESKTLEDFERNLNDENSKINNLDLNGDNRVDYISVYDNVDGNVHNIVLQVAINRMEKQDVAVFTVIRENNGNVFVQLTGDEELYGKNYIIEPNYDDANNGETPNPGYAGNTRTFNGQNIQVVRTSAVEIAAWPMIHFIYLPTYTVWHSSWYWDYYPSYWRPWKPYYWDYYYGYHYNWYNDYYSNYRRWDHHRYSRWDDYYYTSRRSHSTYVNVNINKGTYKSTYSHPEQRKEGEALYTRTHGDQNNRRSDNARDNNQVRRTDPGSNQRRESTDTRTNNGRRSTTTVTNRSEANPSKERSKGTTTTRRSVTTSTNRGVKEQTTRQNKTTVRSGEAKTTRARASERRSANAKKAESAPKKEVKSNEAKKKTERR
jgi:hypothetical protein